MALSRQRMATARRAQSQRRVRFCIHDNEQSYRQEVRREEVFLESEDATNNQDSQAKKEIIS